MRQARRCEPWAWRQSPLRSSNVPDGLKEYGPTASLSDHAPVMADFAIPLGIPARLWDPESFVREVGIRQGEASSNVAEEIIAWAQRKNWQMRNDHPYASLLRPRKVRALQRWFV